jgi:hypothetical protein
MLQTILIGPPRGERKGGIAQFIQFVLHYKPLALRLLLAAAVWGLGRLIWEFLADLGFFAFEIYASLILIRFLADVSQRGELGRILAAMWLPIAVTAVATYLLFVNDQGRELGLGIMDSPARAPFLFLVLIYWGLNNWLSARVGLAREFPQPEKEQVLLFWGPRLVGVTAHLLVAFSLSVAAFSQRDLQTQEPWLVFAAPLAILLATAFAWFLDHGHLSQRSNAALRAHARKRMRQVGGVELLLLAGLVLAWWTGEVPPGFFWGTVAVAASAVAFLGSISWFRRKAPRGKAASDEERIIEERFEENVTRRWTLGLALCMLIGTAAIWIWPMRVGQLFGSLIIASFAFGSFLALTSLFHLLATRLTQYGGSKGFGFGPRAVAAVFLCFLVLPTILTSLTQSFHRVRLCEEKGCTPAPAPEGKNWSAVERPAKRPTVKDAALGWYAQAEPVYHALYPGRPVPMLVVATAGGGIRAAYWTATILERLEDDLRKKEAFAQFPEDKVPGDGLLRHLLFAISGVSGGSVGAAAYAAAVHNHEVNDAAIKPTNYLQQDFLAPGLASMIFIDGIASVLPDFGQIDRGEALELGFESASRPERDKDGLVSHSFLSFFPAIDPAGKLDSWRPVLLFNATHQETGRRIITSHVKIERDVFLDSYDALQVLDSDVRLSTAAHNSARFTYVSPAGNLFSRTKKNRGYIIDGGYFENYGAQTTLELAREAIEAIDAIDPKRENKVKLVVLQISSDPSLKEDRARVRVQRNDGGCVVSSSARKRPIRLNPDGTQSEDQANYLEVIDPAKWNKNEGEGFVLAPYNELSAPVFGIMSVREAHGTIAAAELAGSICQGKKKVEVALDDPMQRKTVVDAVANGANDAPHFSHLAMCEESRIKGGVAVNPPLGWVLSDRTRSRFADILKDCGNDDELAALEKALGLPALASTTTSDAKTMSR